MTPTPDDFKPLATFGDDFPGLAPTERRRPTPASAPEPRAELERVDADHADALVNPATGEAIDVRASSARALFDELDALAQLGDRLRCYRVDVEAELVRRADARAKRKVTLDGVDYEVNAPTSDEYPVAAVEAELEPLVDEGALDADLMRELVYTPPPARPATPAPRVDKRVVARLRKSADPRVIAALDRARRRQENTRTVKLLARSAVDSTAVEEPSE